MADLQAELNRLAGTSGLDAQGAANVGAGTSGLDLVGALNRWAGTSGLELNGACRALATVLGGDASKDGPGALAGASALDPALSSAVWVVDAALDSSGPAITDLAGGLVATPPAPNPKVVGPTSFAGAALIGRMALTAATETGQWMTDVDVRWRAAVLPHHDNDDGTHWAEVFNVPEGNGETDYAEAAVFLRDDGSIGAGYDFDESVSDPSAWQDPETLGIDLGEWVDGLPVHDYRLTIVAATGVATFYQDDEVVHTETLGAVAFDEPPDETPVLVGPANTGLLAIYEVTVLDGIDGDPLYTFDAEDTTGWQAHDTGGAVTTAPARPAWAGDGGSPHLFADSAVFDVGAEASVTWAVAWRPLGVRQSAVFNRNVVGAFFGGGEAGWAFMHVAGMLDNQFRISDGTVTVGASLGTIDEEDHVYVAVLDRATDELRTYVDGVLVATEDATGLGAVSPNTDVALWGACSWDYGAAIFAGALDDGEIDALTGAWG